MSKYLKCSYYKKAILIKINDTKFFFISIRCPVVNSLISGSQFLWNVSFSTYCAAPEMMQLNGIVVNDGFFADGSFIEDNYYTLEEIKHKVYSPLITEDLEETEKFVKSFSRP